MTGRVGYGTSMSMASKCTIIGDHLCIGERRMAVVSKVHDMPRCITFPNVPEGDTIEACKVLGPCRDFICPLGPLCQDTRLLTPNMGEDDCNKCFYFEKCISVLIIKPGLYEFKLKSGDALPDDFYHEDTGLGIEWAKCLKEQMTNVL